MFGGEISIENHRIGTVAKQQSFADKAAKAAMMKGSVPQMKSSADLVNVVESPRRGMGSAGMHARSASAARSRSA
jgi:hypothetical protein